MKFKWGIPRAGLAIILTEMFNMIYTFIQLKEYKRTIFQGIKILPDIPKIEKLDLQYCKTSMPILVHLYCAYFIFVQLTIIEISLNTPSLNAHLAIQTISGLPISLSIGIMSYVGTQMGFGDIKRAKQYVAVGILILVITQTFYASLLWVFQDGFNDFFTAESGKEQFANETRLVVHQQQIEYKELLVEHYKIQNNKQYSIPQYLHILFVVFLQSHFSIIIRDLEMVLKELEKESDFIISKINRENEMQKSTVHQIEEELLYD